MERLKEKLKSPLIFAFIPAILIHLLFGSLLLGKLDTSTLKPTKTAKKLSKVI